MSRPRVLVYISIAGLVAILSSTASKSPTLPLFAEYLGAGPDEIGIIAAASTITGVVVNVTAGTLLDILGRRKLLLLSGFFFATAPFLYLLVTDPWQLIVVRVYHGVATAVFTPVAIAAIADVYRERRGEVMGYFSSATLLGRLMAPSIAGTAITLYSFHGAYIVCGAFGIAALIALLKFPETRKVGEARVRATTRLLSVLTNPRIIIAGSMMAITYFAMQSIETFLPLYMGTLSIEAWLMGLALSIELATIALLKPYGGYLYDHIGSVKVITLGVLLSFLGLLSLSVSTSYILIVASVILFAVGVAFTTASIPPLVAEIAGREAHGTALGAMKTIKDVGQALRPIVMGVTLTYTTYDIAFITVAVIMMIAIILNIAIHRIGVPKALIKR